MNFKKVVFDLTPFVESALESIIGESKPFSAYKVTLELRKMLPTFDIQHEVVKSLVHEIVDAWGSCSVNNIGSFIEYTPIPTSVTASSMFTQLTSNTPGLSAAVDSSFILDLAYLPQKEILIIDMKSGIYAYKDVDINLYEDFYASTSKGQFYNLEIKGVFKACPINNFK